VKTNLPAGLSNLVGIAAGTHHGLGLKNDSTVVAWAAGKTNRNVDPDFGQAIVPAGLTNVVALACGYAHSVALRRDGTVACWVEQLPSDQYAAGADKCCDHRRRALSHARLARGWDTGGLGAGTNTYVSNPHYGQSMVPLDVSNVVAITAGDYHSLALRRDGTIRVWGAGTVTNFAPNYGQAIMPRA